MHLAVGAMVSAAVLASLVGLSAMPVGPIAGGVLLSITAVALLHVSLGRW